MFAETAFFFQETFETVELFKEPQGKAFYLSFIL